jgi:hypothetical protein
MDTHDTAAPVWSRRHENEDDEVRHETDEVSGETGTPHAVQEPAGTYPDEPADEAHAGAHRAGTETANRETAGTETGAGAEPVTVVVEEDVVVVGSHDALDDPDTSAAEESRTAPVGIVWSAGTSGPAEAVPPETSAADVSVGQTGLYDPPGPETDMPETAVPAPDVPESVAPGLAAREPAVGAAADTTASDTTAPDTNALDTSTPGAAAPGAGATGGAEWSEIKAMFVDDPGESVKLASGLVERAIDNLMRSLRQRQESLASWQSGDATSTEELRNAFRGYRSLFDQLDAMSGQFRSGQARSTPPDHTGA